MCVVDGKTNMLESNQKELGQQVIIVNDKLESFVSNSGSNICLLYTSCAEKTNFR